jgi:phosphomannomutase/phosphoglucomutase
VNRGDFSAVANGRAERRDLRPAYLQTVAEQIQLTKPLKLVVDGGNGVAGELACELFTSLGCEVVPLFCEPDGRFPNHHPDPSQLENLSALQLEVQAQEADLGIAFDGDGDRLGIIDNAGNYVWPEHLLMLLATDILQRHPGTDVVFDVKSSRHIAAYVLSNGGRPIMSRSGHTRMKEKMRESGALLGGEFSGHLFIKERWYGSDDAIYAAARLLEVFTIDSRPLDQQLAELPSSPATPEYLMAVEEGEVQALMQQIMASADFGDARLVTLDGLRVEFPQGWGLVRASNTMPSLTFRFEADNDAALADVQQKFRDLVTGVQPAARLPF